MNLLTKCCVLGSTMIVAVFFAGAVYADVIRIDESFTFTNPPFEIISANNPFDFLFTPLPTSPLSDGTIEITGLADFGDPEEFFTLFVDGLSFGTITPMTEDFFASFNVPLAMLATFLADGEVLVRLNLSDEVNFSLEGDFITTRLAFDATVPEPASLGIMLLGLSSLVFLGWVRRTTEGTRT